IVDLMRAGVVELVALEIDLGALPRAALGANMLGDALGVIERARPADIMLVQRRQLGVKGGIGLGRGVGRLEIEHERHQGLGDEAPAENAESAALVGSGAISVGGELVHGAVPRGMLRSDRSSGCSLRFAPYPLPRKGRQRALEPNSRRPVGNALQDRGTSGQTQPEALDAKEPTPS